MRRGAQPKNRSTEPRLNRCSGHKSTRGSRPSQRFERLRCVSRLPALLQQPGCGATRREERGVGRSRPGCLQADRLRGRGQRSPTGAGRCRRATGRPRRPGPRHPGLDCAGSGQGHGAQRKVGSDGDGLRSAGRAIRCSTGRPPSALWYVVNSQLGADPASRVIPLSTSESKVEAFAGQGGLLVWSVDLFRLVRAVENGTFTPANARDQMMHNVGRFMPEIPGQ